jgi:hypothetical protein
LFWRWKSKPLGRPRVPTAVQRLIAEMATANRTWGEERIAAELLVKLGIRLSPRTVRCYMPPSATPRSGRGSQAWSTFVRNHARFLLACDCFVAVTATFGLVYVFVVLELGTRRILHWNTTADHRVTLSCAMVRTVRIFLSSLGDVPPSARRSVSCCSASPADRSSVAACTSTLRAGMTRMPQPRWDARYTPRQTRNVPELYGAITRPVRVDNEAISNRRPTRGTAGSGLP